MRIGIDWGGTKIEVIALDDNGKALVRERLSTPRDDYSGCIKAVCKLVELAESQTGKTGTVGIGIPGTISPSTGLVRNSNSVWMNGMPLLEDLTNALDREVRIQNDANCFTVSEATDGAGAGAHVVAGIIIGTGFGGGIAIDGRAHRGRGGIAAEFGHIPLAPMTEEEFPGEPCWCGKTGCLEVYVSGTGFQRDYDRRAGKASGLSAAEILAGKTPESKISYAAYIDRLGRAVATIINVIDPDVIVFGGGMSNVMSIYDDLPEAVRPHAFTDHFDTPLLKARHGDSSGVRGAAWLWE